MFAAPQMTRMRTELLEETRRDEVQVAETLHACEALSREIQLADREHKELVTALKARCAQMEQSITEYHERLEKAFAAASVSNGVSK